MIKEQIQFLHNLTRTPEHQRDQKWEREILNLLPHSGVNVTHPAAQNGPDGWPYLFCETLDLDTLTNLKSDITVIPNQEIEPVAQILKWLSDKGIGLALNPSKSVPDFVLSYGMIWNFNETGAFLTENSIVATRTVELDAGSNVHAGAPSEKFIPQYVRVILRQFLSEQGVYQPRVLVISNDMKHYDLCFSLESFGNPPEAEHKGILEALAWFLPLHFSLALISETGLPTFSTL